MKKIEHAGLVGLHCPKCGEPLNSRLVAKSYPMAGGHYRRRYCDCGTDVVSVERVVGADVTIAVLSGLEKDRKGGSSDLALVKRMVRRLGGRVEAL